MLYELLTGHKPYRLHGESRADMERAVTAADVVRPSTATSSGAHADALAASRATRPARLRQTLRGDLDVIILKALKKLPAERYATAEAFADDIGRHLRDEPIAARPDSAGYRLRKLVQRNRVAAIAATLALLALLVGSGIALWQSRQADAEARRSRLAYDFMAGLFEQSDPQNAQGRKLTAIDLLNNGAATMETQFQHEPLALAELQSRVGRVYLRMGESPAAIAHLQRAVALYETLGGKPVRPYLDALQLCITAMYNSVHAGSGDDLPGRVAVLARRGLQVSDNALGSRNAYTGPLLASLAWADVAAGHVDAAIGELQAALAVQTARGETTSGVWTTIRGELARLFLRTGQPLKARDIEAQNLQTMLRQPRPDILNLLTGIYMLANTELELSEEALAEQVEGDLLALTDTVSGAQSIDAVMVASQRMLTLAREGKFGAAQSAAADLQRRLAGSSLPESDRRHFASGVGEVLWRSGNAAAAVAWMRPNAAYFSAAAFRGDRAQTYSALTFGQALLADGRVGEAIETLSALRDAVAGSDDARGLRHADVIVSLALAQRAAGQSAEAEARLRVACPAIEAALGTERRSALRCRAALAWVVAGRAPESAAAHRALAAATAAVAASSPGHPLVADLQRAASELAAASMHDPGGTLRAATQRTITAGGFSARPTGVTMLH